MRKFFGNFISFFIPNKKLRKRIRNKYKMDAKYKGLNVVSSGKSLNKFVDWIKKYSTLEVKNIMEIGANYGQDSDFLYKAFKLDPNNVWVFEANPYIFKDVKRIHPFKSFNYAVFNKNGTLEFNVCDTGKMSENTGISSIYDIKDKKRNQLLYKSKVNVKSVRMDDFMKKNKINEIYFLKLDVEGCNFEVLDGFGDRLKDVKSIHVEAEHIEFWKNQKLYNDIEKLLKKFGFDLIYFERYTDQSDSFWIKKEYIKL